MAHTLQIFVSILMVMLCLAVFIPYIRTSVGTSGPDVDVDAFGAIVAGSTYLTIGVNIVALPLWTFGLNWWINIIILLPLRIVGVISLWYIISPAK